MSADLTPFSGRQALSRRERQAAALLRFDTSMQIEAVRDAGLVRAAALRELDHLAFTAMTGQSVLAKAAAAMSQEDPFLATDLRYFTEIARMAKGEVLADFADDVRRRR